MQNSKLIHFLLFLVFIVLIGASCNDSDPMPVPNVPMDVTINLNTDAEFTDLRAPATSIKLTKHPQGRTTIGFDNNGLIIYHQEFWKTFYAFDATCPHDLPESISLIVEGSSATCPKCNSVYVLPSEGQPAAGSVSKFFLKKYRTNFNANNADLWIFN